MPRQWGRHITYHQRKTKPNKLKHHEKGIKEKSFEKKIKMVL
jgi:hypothetical protein